MPHAFLLTPFSSIGLVAEGGASRALVQRLGPAKANEALIMSKRLWAKELLDAGYLNEIFDYPKGEDAAFRERVLKEVDERLGDHLNGESLVGIKKLIRRPELETIHNANVHEVFAGLDRFVRLDKGGFAGRDALVRQRKEGVPHRFVTLSVEVDDADARGNEPIYRGESMVGRATAGAPLGTTP